MCEQWNGSFHKLGQVFNSVYEAECLENLFLEILELCDEPFDWEMADFDHLHALLLNF